MQFLKQRRSIRWFKKKKVDKETFDKLFEAAYYSPSAQNAQDVEFVVLDEKLDDFMHLVYDIIKVEEDEFFLNSIKLLSLALDKVQNNFYLTLFVTFLLHNFY